jgi:hypothetical protein
MTQEQHAEPTPQEPETTSGSGRGTPDHEPPARTGGENPNREAAKYRRERNEARAERDALRERLDAAHRAEVERQARERFTDPGDVWAVTNLDQLRGEDGLLDIEKAEAAFRRIEEEKPHWKKRPEMPDLHQGRRPSVETPSTPSFGQAVKQAVRGR